MYTIQKLNVSIKFIDTRNLGTYKLARQVLEKIQSLRVPPRFQVIYQEIIFCTQIMLCSILQGSRAFAVVWSVFYTDTDLLRNYNQ
jgi:hypothetical protein